MTFLERNLGSPGIARLIPLNLNSPTAFLRESKSKREIFIGKTRMQVISFNGVLKIQ